MTADDLACKKYKAHYDVLGIHERTTDSISARETFLACGEEYAGRRRIFTEEQMEKMREIY